jgi:hypothetical protein
MKSLMNLSVLSPTKQLWRSKLSTSFSALGTVLQRWGESSWFAYLTILLLQLKRIGGAWQYRDLTSGDTSSYFIKAFSWAKELSVNYLWSPLYTAFYGTVYKLVPDVYVATLLHRFVIVFVLAILVLAVMRRLLPPKIAWWVTAWWVILPINFDTLYEVHLFAVILPLAALLLVLYKPGLWARGGALGILLATALLVRNEIMIAFGLWLIACLIYEVHQYRLKSGHKFKTYLLAYAGPVLLAIFVFAFFSSRTLIKPSPAAISLKHTLNVCQIYSFGYQQRHSDWQKSPWTECQELMLRDFGKPLPTLLEAIQANPRAMLDHFVWNLRLLPAGLQVALFNASSEHFNPDYAPTQLDMPIIWLPSLLAITIFVAGVWRLCQEKNFWWSAWLKERLWGWILFFCLAAVMLVVIPMQRPRPSYMFLLTLLLMALIGMCSFFLTHRIRTYVRLTHLFPLVVMITLLSVPQYYLAGSKPFLKFYKALEASSEYIGIPGTGFVSLGYSQNLCNYYTKSGNGGCLGFGYDVFNDMVDGDSVGALLDRQSVPVVALFIEENFLTSYGNLQAVQIFLKNPEQEGWKLVSFQDSSTGREWVYVNVRKLNKIVPELPINLSEK